MITIKILPTKSFFSDRIEVNTSTQNLLNSYLNIIKSQTTWNDKALDAYSKISSMVVGMNDVATHGIFKDEYSKHHFKVVKWEDFARLRGAVENKFGVKLTGNSSGNFLSNALGSVTKVVTQTVETATKAISPALETTKGVIELTTVPDLAHTVVSKTVELPKNVANETFDLMERNQQTIKHAAYIGAAAMTVGAGASLYTGLQVGGALAGGATAGQLLSIGAGEAGIDENVASLGGAVFDGVTGFAPKSPVKNTTQYTNETIEYLKETTGLDKNIIILIAVLIVIALIVAII